MLICEDEVHVLAIRLDMSQHGGVTRRASVAARLERTRAATCTVLGRYLGLAASQVELTSNEHGKPELAIPSALRFNVSHSGDLLVLALARGIEVGVDVERVRSMPRALHLAGRFFRQEEVEALQRFSSDDLDRAFFHCWTQKEAYLKAIGLGLDADLRSFRVACDPPASAAMEWISGDDAACWSMHVWEPWPEYTAALAFRDRGRRLRRMPLIEEIQLYQPSPHALPSSDDPEEK